MKKTFALFIVLSIICVIFLFSVFTQEKNNNDLRQDFQELMTVIEIYRKYSGHYPANILEIRESDELCLGNRSQKCRQIYYKVAPNLDEFRLVVPTFSRGHLYFSHPDMDFISKDKIQEKLSKFGRTCFPCEATLYPNSSFPRYKSDPKFFNSPDMYPDIDEKTL